MKKPPPQSMRLNSVPAYILRTYGVSVTSRTVRNWVEKGLRRETLETRQVKNPCPSHKDPLVMVTTTEWVDLFLSRCQLRMTRSAK